jgi:hypothetical protein
MWFNKVDKPQTKTLVTKMSLHFGLSQQKGEGHASAQNCILVLYKVGF